MSGPGQGSSSSEDHDREVMRLGIIFLVIVFILIALAQRYVNHANAAIGALAYMHVAPFAEAVRFLPALLDVPGLGGWLFMPAARVHDFLYGGGYAFMEPDQRSLVLIASGRAALVLYAPVLFWIALRAMDFRPDAKFSHQHSLESMIHLQTEDWVTARIARHVNPSRMKDVSTRGTAEAAAKRIAKMGVSGMPGKVLPRRNLSLAPDTWNRALRPEEWLIAKGLIFDAESFSKLSDPTSMSRDGDFSFRHRWPDLQLESVSEVMAQQLRTPWRGVQDLRPSHRALFAVMALFYDYDIKSGNGLLADIAIVNEAARARKGLMDGLLEAEPKLMARIDGIASGSAGKKLQKHAARHAWVETAFPTFLTVSRKDRGVLPSSAFLWLKAEDRLLWYVLNNVGNEAIMIEAAGAIAHWRAECQIGKPIHRPAVFQASRALMDDYLDLRAERLEVRRMKAERMRIPGDQIDLNLSAAMGAKKTLDPDGLEEA